MRIFLICLLLTGCAAFDPEPYNIKQDTVTVQVVINPMLTAFDYKGDIIHPMGTAERKDGKCLITLREYPVCLAHEVRHCFEGAWHPKASKYFPGNDDDCWQDGQQQNVR